MRIGFVGLGAMGSAMAESLLAQGHELAVYNRTVERAAALRGKGARVAASPADAARGAEVVISMLANDAAVEAVTFGDDGIVAGLAEEAVHVSSSTISVALSDRLAKHHQAARKQYVSAPVFGRPDAAAERTLWIVAAGPTSGLDICQPVFEALGRGVTRLGDSPELANVVKLAGNFIIASMLETLGEAFALTRKAGVSPDVFAELFTNVFARSAIFEGYARRIAKDEYLPAGFQTVLALKDLGLVLALGESSRVPLPLASLVHAHLLEGIARGQGELDWAALARFAAERAGVSG